MNRDLRKGDFDRLIGEKREKNIKTVESRGGSGYN
jgi:hypothetical protein